MADRILPVRITRASTALVAVLLALLLPGAVFGQEGNSDSDERRLITPDDYHRFESLGQASFSPDARHLAVTVSRFDDDGEVRVIPLDGGETRIIEKATSHSMAPEGSWLALVTGPSHEERQAMQERNESVRNDLLLLNLENGQEFEVERVQGFSFSEDGRFILMRRYPPSGGGGNGNGRDIVIRDLQTGLDVNFGNVAQAEWSHDDALLAMTIDAGDMAGNGVRLFDAHAGTIRTLASEEARFSALTWREESRDLAVFRQELDDDRGDTVYSVLAWRSAHEGDRTPLVLDGHVDDFVGSPADAAEVYGIGTQRGIQWAEDGSRLFVGVQPRDPLEDEPDADPEEEAPAEEETDDEGDEPEARRGGAGDSIPGLEIWHSRDVDPVPQQRVRANMERNRSHLMAWDLSGPPVILGGGMANESIALLPNHRGAILQDDDPYALDRMFGPIYRDVYRVDIETGERTLLAERVEFARGVSPEARYFLFFEDDHFHTIDLSTGEVRNITGELDGVFANQETDVVVPQRPPYGNAGWTEDDAHVLIYDRHDLWRVRPDGSGGERLTRGAEDEVRHRVVRLDFDEPAFPDDGPWLFSLFGEWTKESGYGRLASPGGEVERLVWEDRMISRLSRADDGETHFYMSQRFDDPPAFHRVDGDLSNPTTLTRANDFIDEFFIGRSELVDYENEWGVPLQGALYYPADYEPGREYPMIVYHYERLSQGIHGWTNPSDRTSYNTRVFTQNGYFVLQPDIVYRPRNPGLSAMEAILPAVDAAVAAAPIDESAIGIIGHSWGGYQTTFAVTQTDRFAAAVAGAPLTNLMSMYLSFYWNTGSTDARIFEISQGRMEVPWWEDFDSYRANSPVHHIEAMNTPLLMMFGTEDGAVEFNQGVEFYNAARRAAKDFVLLVYEGENHSLAQRPNQEDYHLRTLEWFAHYLKGEPAPEWITDGVPYLDQQEKLERGPAAGRR